MKHQPGTAVGRTLDLAQHAETSLKATWHQAALMNLRNAACAESRRDLFSAKFHRSKASFCYRKMGELV